MSQSSSPCPQSWHEAETAAAIPILSCLKTASPPSPTPNFLTDNFPVRKLVTPDYSALFQLTAKVEPTILEKGYSRSIYHIQGELITLTLDLNNEAAEKKVSLSWLIKKK